MNDSPLSPQDIVDFKDYVHVKRRLDLALDCVERYEESMQTGIELDFFRQSLARVITGYCRSQPAIRRYLKLTHAQLADISDDGELPPSAVRAFKEQLIFVRERLSACL